MTIEERIERLEGTNLRYRLMFSLIGVIAVCIVGVSAIQDDKVPDVIRAKAFEVVDDEGNPLVKLFDFNSTGNGSIAIFNKVGNTPLAMMAGINSDGIASGTVFTFRGRKKIVELSYNELGRGTVKTYNENEKAATLLGSDVDGGHVFVYNKTSQPVCALTVNKYGNGVIAVMDRNGNGRTLEPGP